MAKLVASVVTLWAITSRGLALPAAIPTPTTSTAHSYINMVPGYSVLVDCAQTRLSAIVRGMSSGCGDGGVYTSKACFCQESRLDMESTIISAVSEQCNGAMANASSAIAVFKAYCGATTTLDEPATAQTAMPGHVPGTTSQQATDAPTPSPVVSSQPTATATMPTNPSHHSSTDQLSSGSIVVDTIRGVTSGFAIIVVFPFYLLQRRRKSANRNRSIRLMNEAIEICGDCKGPFETALRIAEEQSDILRRRSIFPWLFMSKA